MHRALAACALLALCLSQARSDSNLPGALLEAQESQEFRMPNTEDVKSQIVKEAPEAVLANGVADISTLGLCAGDIDVFCIDTHPGEGRIADCITKHREEEKKGNSDGRKVSSACLKEVEEFKINRAKNINLDVKLAAACKEDSATFCQEDAAFPEPGSILSCLREFKPKLSEACAAEVFRTQLDAAKDLKVDAMLNELCAADGERLCKSVPDGDGAMQECLRSQPDLLAWECREELFRQDVENADDMRLHMKLYRACLSDKKKFCPDIAYGHINIKDCLESHKEEDDFGSECKDELDKDLVKQGRDYRLNAGLRTACMVDIDTFCQTEAGKLTSVASHDGVVVSCLVDFHDVLTVDACKDEVKKVMIRASSDIRMAQPLADACFDDRERHCGDVAPGSSRVIRCLSDAHGELTPECQAALFDHNVLIAQSIDFDQPTKQACSAEIEQLCPGVKSGHARIISCLQNNLDKSEMGSECKKRVAKHARQASTDYRLNFRLSEACESDIEVLCADECAHFLGQPCGGKVLRCLRDHADDVASSECRTEIRYFEKMEVTDFRNDVILAEACREDVGSFCADVEPGEGRVHECLKANLSDLSKNCRTEEVKLMRLQNQDMRLRPKLQKACAEELSVYCKDVKPGRGRMFQCLMEKMAEPDFSTSCLAEVEKREGQAKNDYRFDAGVSEQCAADVDEWCATEKNALHGHAEVLKCLLSRFVKLAEPCQQEMSRATRNALWAYTPGSHFTDTCDTDVERICPATATSLKREVFTIGSVGRCLAKQAAAGGALSPDCKLLVTVAAPKNVREMLNNVGSSSALAQRYADLEKAGVRAGLVGRSSYGPSFITLSGWVALWCIMAMILVVVLVSVFVYRRFISGVDKPYTILMGTEPMSEASEKAGLKSTPAPPPPAKGA